MLNAIEYAALDQSVHHALNKWVSGDRATHHEMGLSKTSKPLLPGL
jgi:hypothetical protein